ncbi:hypothetical protein BDF21DRAFT_395826 [Thamnidium elegans]|nr:hypothetical protein BDF21DRAFT_395826 [Thamnidium elegans]
MIDGDNDNKKGNSSNDGMDVGIENAKEAPERVAYPIGGSFGKSSVNDYHILCHDLLILGILAIDSVDRNKLNYALVFQIHGFSVYLISFPRHKLYEMIEIAYMTFSRSLEELFIIC